ncbi:MAG: BamA/TamA family outer membrane protein [Myxococcaceae bacterium]
MGLLIFLIFFSFSSLALQVQVVGSRAFRAEAIRERILAKVGTEAPEDRQLEQLRFQILGLYRKSGFIDAKLEFLTPKPNQLICNINEGSQVVVKDVQVLGGQYFSNDLLKAKILEFVKSEPVESGLIDYDHIEIDSILNPTKLSKKKLNWVFFGDGFLPFNKSLFLKAKESLEEFYLDNGFLEIQIFGPKESEITQEHWINLQFRIEEGLQTRVTEIHLDGAQASVLEPAIKIGDPLNPNLVEDYRVQLEESFWNQGYPNAEITAEIKGSQIFYQINLGDRIQIENIVISGNQITLKRVIENRLKIKKGDWFSLEKLTDSRSRILQTDLFSEVDISLDGRTLLVNVKERERNTLEMGFGASFEDGPRITGIWQYRNIFGRGISFRTRTQANYPAIFYDLPIFYPSQIRDALKSQTSNYFAGKVTTGFLYPKMLGIPFDLDSAIDFSAERALKPAYVLNRASSLISLFSQVTSNLRVTPQLEVEYDDVVSPASNANSLIPGVRYEPGIVKQGTVRLLSLWDHRDNPLLPKKGYAIQFDADFGFGLFAEKTPISYSKLLAGLTTYTPLVKRLTWVFNGKAGGIWNLTSEAYVPVFKRFYLGGTNSVRGFSDDQIFPVDNTQQSQVSLGGNYFAFMRNEIRFPISGDLEGGVFVDTGELMQDIKNFGFDKLAMGTGFGIRYNTPIGPLMLDLGYRVLDANRLGNTSFINRLGLHFSIGNSI